MVGKTLGDFEITAPLGRGGMGEVYRAMDQKLGRDVAIKVLPEEFAKDADRIARFQREAKLLASLNHPNIAAIYGLEESGGTNFLVLELVEGETLADRLKRGPIPVEESLKLALQIAEALEAAHEKGVIHRDLKPANIKVTPDGKVKVLDFGLAKAFSGDQRDLNLSNSPTLSAAATQQGIILGTAGYMSPEQARGKSVDKGADIWAFGSVLFEMLTGHVAFRGEDVSEILASVIKGDVNLELLPANLHPRVREAITSCLQRDQKRRYSSITQARYEIEQALADPGSGFLRPAASVEHRTRLRQIFPWVSGAVVLTAMFAGVAVWKLKPQEPRPIARFSCLLPEDQSLGRVFAQVLAVSPHGNRFVCATTGGLFLRSMDQLDGGIIPGTEGEVGAPFFSPDGQWVGYYSTSDRQLKRIPVGGGSPVSLCNYETDVGNPLWGMDNIITFDSRSRIMRVPGDGGTPQTLVEEKGKRFFAPQILPDGETVLFTLSPSDQIMDMKIAVQSLKTGKRTVLFAGQHARYLSTGHIVYVRDGNLYAIRFDLNKLAVKGGPVPMVPNIAVRGAALYAVSDSGTLVYAPKSSTSVARLLVWVDRRNGTEEVLDAQPRAYTNVHLSPDGTQVALEIRDQQSNLSILDLASKKVSRLTFDPGWHRGGIWTPDGEKLAFVGGMNGAQNVYLQSANGSGAPRPLAKTPGGVAIPSAFSPDASQILFACDVPMPRQIYRVILNGSAEPEILLRGSLVVENAQISPDGRWLAYESNELNNRKEVFVRPFPDVNAGEWQISTDGGTHPLWNRNGRELFYYILPGTMMAAPVETGSSFKPGTPKVVFKGEYYYTSGGENYAVTRDGQRFLMIKDAAAKPGGKTPPQQINVALNWLEELKQRVPVK